MNPSRPRILAVVPARFGASRFPGKPLVLLGGQPVIRWVYEAASRSGVFDEVVVATDDARIAEVVASFGGRFLMTRDDHATGTDRVAEVAERLPDFDVVVNVQGDQPFVTREMLVALVAPYQADANDRPAMSTVGCPVHGSDTWRDPNSVKVVLDREGNALYFSRASIPSGFDETSELPVLHHLGLYAFRRDFLPRFATLSATPLERAERLEQLRALEHGVRIRVAPVSHAVPEINTPEDLATSERMLASGELPSPTWLTELRRAG